jgi:hypothetical protein
MTPRTIKELLAGRVDVGATVTVEDWPRTRRDLKAGLSFLHGVWQRFCPKWAVQHPTAPPSGACENDPDLVMVSGTKGKLASEPSSSHFYVDSEPTSSPWRRGSKGQWPSLSRIVAISRRDRRRCRCRTVLAGEDQVLVLSLETEVRVAEGMDIAEAVRLPTGGDSSRCSCACDTAA